MVGLSILRVPAPVRSKPARQELHQQSLSVVPISVPAQMNTAHHPQREQNYQECLQIMPGPASLKTEDSVKTFVCVSCPGVVSLVIGEFLEFQVK